MWIVQGPEGKLRTMELVPGSKLQERRDAMSAVSCVHVYSVQRRLYNGSAKGDFEAFCRKVRGGGRQTLSPPPRGCLRV